MSTYFSIDIETDGLCPGLNSMISLGAVAFDPDKETIADFSINLKPLPDATPDPDTMKWWDSFPDAYKAATDLAVTPVSAMETFAAWVSGFGDIPVACYWKPEFDGAFIRYYSFRFLGRQLFGRSGSGIDIKSVAALALKQKYSDTQIAKVPREWSGNTGDHSHKACLDAREQAYVFINALKTLNATL